MKTTKKDFEVFKKECLKWVEFYGLKDWRISYDQKDTEANAETRYFLENKSAVISLSNKYPCETTLGRLAFHEVSELLLVEITHKLNWFLNTQEVNTMAHTIIRRLENSVFEKLK